LVRALDEARRITSGKSVWRQRRHNLVAVALHTAQRLGWRWVNASTLEIPQTGRISLAEAALAMVRRLA
jgi:hypothetical protein